MLFLPCGRKEREVDSCLALNSVILSIEPFSKTVKFQNKQRRSNRKLTYSVEREAGSPVSGQVLTWREFQHLDPADSKEQDRFFTLVWKGEGGWVSLQSLGFFSARER